MWCANYRTISGKPQPEIFTIFLTFISRTAQRSGSSWATPLRLPPPAGNSGSDFPDHDRHKEQEEELSTDFLLPLPTPGPPPA